MFHDDGQDGETAAYRVKMFGKKYSVVDANDHVATLPDGTPAEGFDDQTYANDVANRLNEGEELHEGTPEVTDLFDPYPDEDDGDVDQDSDDWDEDD
jgi:hypothetical protein